MVPYLVTRQGIPLAEAAREFGITEEELVKDLELLFVCGTPGHMPDDLIDAEWDDGHVYLRNADTIARPLRLGIDEALSLHRRAARALRGPRRCTTATPSSAPWPSSRLLRAMPPLTSAQVSVEVEGEAEVRWPPRGARSPTAAGCT